LPRGRKGGPDRVSLKSAAGGAVEREGNLPSPLDQLTGALGKAAAGHDLRAPPAGSVASTAPLRVSRVAIIHRPQPAE
jgi:hypothetical protein